MKSLGEGSVSLLGTNFEKENVIICVGDWYLNLRSFVSFPTFLAIILSFEAVQSPLLTASLDKLQAKKQTCVH